jgi:hypothetical protein
MNTTQLQQGDVTLKRIDAIPKGERTHIKRTARGLVLAEGEATGHAHTIEEADAELIQIGERMILKLLTQATIVHEEHKPVTLEPGIYEVGRVREYDYFQQMARRVAD